MREFDFVRKAFCKIEFSPDGPMRSFFVSGIPGHIICNSNEKSMRLRCLRYADGNDDDDDDDDFVLGQAVNGLSFMER